MDDQPPHSREAKLDALRQALIEGVESVDAGPLDLAEIEREAREVGLARLKRTVSQSEASGEAVPFDMDAWLEKQDELDSAA